MSQLSISAKQKVGWSVLLSLFWVISMWGFFDKGPLALGLNSFLYLGGVLAFFVLVLYRENRYKSHDLAWIIPMGLVVLSFTLFENPFFKMFSLLLFTPFLGVFYTYAWVEHKEDQPWGFSFAGKIIERILSAFTQIGNAIKLLFSFLAFQEHGKRATAKRVITGLLVLIVCLFVILPLLTSADGAFGNKLGAFYDLIKEILATSIMGKLLVFLILSVSTLAMLLGWARTNVIDVPHEQKPIDDVVSGITLGGILLFYLIFLWVQVDRLWLGALPFNFQETEGLVKSGFWQLLALSFINLGIFFVLYRKTTPIVQKVLGVFTIASFLLLTSSAHRMWLYVTYYGFSYEKFYASYAVLFCAILFIWLLSRLVSPHRANVIKFVAFLFLWMFALVSVFPVEQFIFRTNFVLAQKPDSRIVIDEMKMLSPDVLKSVKERRLDWGEWILDRQKQIDSKRWYEQTLSALVQ